VHLTNSLSPAACAPANHQREAKYWSRQFSWLQKVVIGVSIYQHAQKTCADIGVSFTTFEIGAVLTIATVPLELFYPRIGIPVKVYERRHVKDTIPPPVVHVSEAEEVEYGPLIHNNVATIGGMFTK
jgi:hypothetical protein